MCNDLGPYILECRRALDLTQEQLAERVGGTYLQADISRLERGLTEVPRLSTMASLAAALEVPVGNLLIASGWFDQGCVTRADPARDATSSNLEAVLGEIEDELTEILALESQAQMRAKNLSIMIRNLKATSRYSTALAAD